MVGTRSQYLPELRRSCRIGHLMRSAGPAHIDDDVDVFELRRSGF